MFDDDFNAAAEYYRRALGFAPDNAALMEKAVQSLMALGRFDEAVPIARRIEEQGLRSQAAHMVVLADLVAKGDFCDGPAAWARSGRRGAAGGRAGAGLGAAWRGVGQEGTGPIRPRGRRKRRAGLCDVSQGAGAGLGRGFRRGRGGILGRRRIAIPDLAAGGAGAGPDPVTAGTQ
ncbi:tetratricopeptide repeat protein [Jhaorihella thermophila]